MAAACIFIQAASNLAQASWLVAYRRVPEAIGANVWVFGTIAAVIMFIIVFCYRDSHGIDAIYPG